MFKLCLSYHSNRCALNNNMLAIASLTLSAFCCRYRVEPKLAATSSPVACVITEDTFTVSDGTVIITITSIINI